MSETLTAEDQAVANTLARILYLGYCEQKGFDPNPMPYIPAWARDYADTAVRLLGYDDETMPTMMGEVR